MIEKVMNERDTKNTIDVRIPKNIKQIGENGKYRKIYVEDSVMAELGKKPQNEDKVRYGVLLGEMKRSKGITYVFIKGIVENLEVIENSIIFNDDIWADIYKDVKQYYSGEDIVGWFVNVPYTVTKELSSLKKLHLDNFAGNDKVCYVSDRSEKEDGFFAYESGDFKRQSGYYIFYEKNDSVKRYVQQTEKKKNSEGAKDVAGNSSGELKARNMSFREMLKQQFNESEENTSEKTGKITYVLSSVLIVALLMSTVVMMNNYGELKSLKSSIDNINMNDNVVAMNEIISSIVPVANIVETETVSESEVEVSSIEETEMLEKDFVEEEELENWSEDFTTENVKGANSGIYTGMYHTVEKGQTLYDISVSYYGSDSMIEEIKELNDIDDDYMIREGQTIVLP